MSRPPSAFGTSLSAAIGRCAQELIWLSGRFLYQRWFELRVQGRQNLPTRGPYLLASNHASHLDGPAIMAAQGMHYRRVFSLGARDYFFRGKLRAWLSTYILNMIPIDRGRPDFLAINRCRQVAERAGIILMFPEGTRSLSGEVQPFKLGLGLIAQRLGVPIVPVLVHGTFQSLPKGARFPRRGPIDVVFGEPIDVPRADEAAGGRPSYLETARLVSRAVTALRDALLESRNDRKRDMQWNKAPLTQSL